MSLVLFLAPANAEPPVDLETYDINVSRGLLEFSRGHYEKAETLLRAALGAKPGDSEAGYYLGQTLLRLKKYEAAERIFRQLLESEPASGRAWLGLGIVQYDLGQLADALASLTAAEKSTPNEPLVHYYLGLIYHELEAYEKSPERFRQAMTLSPDLAPSAHYYSGVAYYRRGIFDKAQAEFESVIATQPESELARAAKEFLSQATDAAKGPQRWNLSFTLSSEWDSNVVLIPNDTQPPGGVTGISKQQDYRTSMYARGEFRAIQTDQWLAGASYGIYQSFHRTLSGFDVEDHSPTVFVQRQLGTVQIGLQYVFNYTLVGRAPYLIAHAIQPIITLSEGNRSFTQVQLRYQNKDFQHGRFTFNSARDGKNWLAGVTQYLLFAENAGNIRVGYVYDMDRTGGGSPTVAGGETTNADWAYKGHRFLAGIGLPPIRTVKLDLAADYYLQRYDNPNSFSTDGTTRRRDHIYSFTGTLSRSIGENFSVALQYSYTRDENNLRPFDYNRSIYSLVFSGRF